ncbi:MAG: DNA primase catalytic subunit PriS [Candidatus Heimdallarchaeota archaeon]|nr:DNA primase catalytic subunit PriS [Candidatus Heimdallarchaeota archaeon]
MTENANNSQGSSNNQPVPIELIQRYYRDVFDPGDLISTIGLSTFYRREFAVLLEEEVFIRNISFKSSAELIDFLSANPVRRAFVGAVYEVPPTKRDTIQKIKWEAREFCFDLDLNDYDPVRVCGCRGKEQYCASCWSLVQDAAAFLDRTLREDFGFTDIDWFFSGRRGFHAWVKDPESRELAQEQRISIVRYLSLIKDESRTQAVEKDLSQVVPFRDRIIELIARSFFARASEAELRASPFNFTKRDIDRLKINLNNQKQSFNRIYNTLLGKKHDRNKIFTYIISHRYPRIDRKVSIDIRRLLKVPGSVQGSNGKICCKVDIKKIHEFFPDNAPTVWDQVE